MAYNNIRRAELFDKYQNMKKLSIEQLKILNIFIFVDIFLYQNEEKLYGKTETGN